MKKTFYLLLSLISFITLQSNDSVVNGSGTDIFPISESRISIKKEILTLTLKDDKMNVDVYFEFYNPDEERELTVGFVVPPSFDREPYDSIDIENRTPVIYGFKVAINNYAIPYERDILKDTPYDSLKQIEGEWHYAYHFKAKFKNGLNIVRHNYIFEGGFSGNDKFYDYVLKTAKNWANSEIEDFTLNLDLGKNNLFWVDDISENDNWEIVGSGKSEERYAHQQKFILKEGYVRFHEKNFSPIENINIYFPSIVDGYNKEDITYQANWARSEYLKTLNKKQLQLARNFFFAKNGYNFKSQEIKDFYSQYFWYLPNSKITSEEIFEALSEDEKRRIDLIRKIEEEKK